MSAYDIRPRAIICVILRYILELKRSLAQLKNSPRNNNIEYIPIPIYQIKPSGRCIFVSIR